MSFTGSTEVGRLIATQCAPTMKRLVMELGGHAPLIIFADSPADPRFTQQIENIRADPNALRVRDVVVLTDTDPAAHSPLRQKLRPRGFMLVLIAKDGSVTQRKPLPWSVREITRAIDKTPERKREIEDRRSDG